ncbi:MAG: MFS transporter [Chlamydiia bacterium]|nr:MFS transporter [Chlamydiia bacterium]
MNLNYRRLASLFGIGSGAAILGLVFTSINTTLPLIQDSLHLPLKTLQWMMLTFGLINCSFLVISGRFADIFGRKRIYLIGLLFSGSGMLIGGLSQTSPFMILSMAFIGLGNSIVLPVSQAMLVAAFPKDQKSFAISIWAVSIAIAMAVGPLASGLLSQFIGWEGVFLAIIPLVAISFLLVLLFAKESKNHVDLPSIDSKGMVFLSTGLLSTVLLITEYSHFSVPMMIFLLAFSITTFSLLWKHSETASVPILVKEFIKSPQFVFSSLASFCLIFYLWATFFLLPLYLQNIRHLSPIATGIALLGVTVPVAFLSPLLGKKYHHHRSWKWIFFGFFSIFLSAILQVFYKDLTAFPLILLSLILSGIGFSFVLSPTAATAFCVVPEHKVGIASGTFITFQEVGGTLGLAICSMLLQLHPNFLSGMRWATYALIVISFLGALCSLMLNPKRKF